LSSLFTLWDIMPLTRKKAGLLDTVKTDTPVIIEHEHEEFEVIDLPEVPNNDLSSHNSEILLLKGNMPVNTYQLRGSIGTHLDTLRRLQEWFETAIHVLLSDLELIREVEELVIARGGQSTSGRKTRGAELLPCEPIGYNPQFGGLFISFMYSRLSARVWKIFGAPSLRYQMYEGDQKNVTPMSLVKILMRSARLAAMVVLQTCDRRRDNPRSSSNRVQQQQAIVAHFRDCQSFRMPRILYEYPMANMRRSAPAASAIGAEVGTRPQQIARHYNKLLDIIRSQRDVFEPFLIPASNRLVLCSAGHMKPTFFFKSNIDIVEAAVWTRYELEHAHVNHHMAMTSHMRLGKGGVKKGRLAYGMTDEVAKGLVEDYEEAADIVARVASEGKQEVEQEMERLFQEQKKYCPCDKVFHIEMLK